MRVSRETRFIFFLFDLLVIGVSTVQTIIIVDLTKEIQLDLMHVLSVMLVETPSPRSYFNNNNQHEITETFGIECICTTVLHADLLDSFFHLETKRGQLTTSNDILEPTCKKIRGERGELAPLFLIASSEVMLTARRLLHVYVRAMHKSSTHIYFQDFRYFSFCFIKENKIHDRPGRIGTAGVNWHTRRGELAPSQNSVKYCHKY